MAPDKLNPPLPGSLTVFHVLSPQFSSYATASYYNYNKQSMKSETCQSDLYNSLNHGTDVHTCM